MSCSCQEKPAATSKPGGAVLAIAEAGVFECSGPDCAPQTKTIIPSGVQFDRFNSSEAWAKTPTDRRARVESTSPTFDIPTSVQEMWAEPRQASCLPWVRVTRDPANFQACLDAARRIGPLTHAKKCFQLVRDFYARQDQEVFLVVLLDTQLQVRGVGEISRGARDSVQVPVPDVLRLPLVEGATAIVVVHNHPSGKVQPSKADKALTKALKQACSTVDVALFDHLIVAPDTYFSFANANLLKH